MRKILRASLIFSLLILAACTSGNREASDALDEIGDRIFTSSRNKNESVVYNAKYYSDEKRQIVIFEIGLPNSNGALELRNVDCWKDTDETRFDCETSRPNDNSELGRLLRQRLSLAELYYWSAETDQPTKLQNQTIYEYSDRDLTRVYASRYRP